MEELPLGTDSKLFTALSAAARKHGAAVLGLHPATKTVRFHAPAIIRLKRAFRH